VQQRLVTNDKTLAKHGNWINTNIQVTENEELQYWKKKAGRHAVTTT
jgi:hypothetical protein